MGWGVGVKVKDASSGVVGDRCHQGNSAQTTLKKGG